MNRRGFFSLLAGASVAALAPALFARTDYTKGQVFRFLPAAENSGPVTLSINGARPVVIGIAGDYEIGDVLINDVRAVRMPDHFGASFAAGSLATNVAPANLSPAAGQLLSTLTPPLA